MPLQLAKTYNELIKEGKEAEANKDLDGAAKAYERAIKQEPHQEFPYDRLMMIYRKQYRYEDELNLINKGIEAFESYYKRKSRKLVSKNKEAEKLSLSLAKSLGLTDKKGNDVYHIGPVDKWLKRKAAVEKKLGKGPAKKTTKKKK